VRRIRFIIDFPFPDEASRLEIWKVHFPKRAPRSDDIDYPLLAKKFAIPGGNIKNVVLNAAFMAAKEDGPIRMEHLLEGTKHEYEKIGKLWSADSSVDSPAKSSTR
jgi:ATP-dependent 26S proteasome regulatory subunit